MYKYGASDRRYQELRPNNLVFREGIRDLCGKGVRTLSFGRTDLHHEGLRQFKLSWGAVEKTLQYVKYDVTSKAYLSTKKSRATIPWESTVSKLPLPLLRLDRTHRLPTRRVVAPNNIMPVLKDTYYQVKPLLPRRLQIAMRRARARDQAADARRRLADRREGGDPPEELAGMAGRETVRLRHDA